MKEREQIRKTEIWKTHLDSYRLQAKKKSKKKAHPRAKDRSGKEIERLQTYWINTVVAFPSGIHLILLAK